MILLVDDRRDMQILVRVHAPNDTALASFDAIHSQPPACTVDERLRRDRVRGQDSHETMRSGPSRVTGIGEAKPHRRAFPGGRQVQGKTRLVDQSAGQATPRRPTAPAYQAVDQCLSQTAQELAMIF